jgi:hypothetical protein
MATPKVMTPRRLVVVTGGSGYVMMLVTLRSVAMQHAFARPCGLSLVWLAVARDHPVTCPRLAEVAPMEG